MTTKGIAPLSLALALGLAVAPALAEDEKDAKVSGSVTVAAQGGSGLDDSSKLQQFETVPEGAFLKDARFSWKGDGGYFLQVKGKKLGLDDQFASLLFGKKGAFALDLRWDQNPNWMSNTARTPYVEVAPGVFHVPDGMRQSLQAIYLPWTGSAPANPTVANFHALQSWVDESSPIDLRYLRKTGKAGLAFEAGESWAFDVNFTRETRDGNKNTSFYANPIYEVATPIAYTTNDIRAQAEFASDKVFGTAAVSFSKFTNDVLYATIDNPQRLDLVNPTTGRSVTNDAAAFRLWLPPDNEAVNGDLTAGVKLPRNHRVTGSLSVGSMKMDHELVALSTNAALATTSSASFTVVPPYDDVEARFDNFMGAVKLTGDPTSKFGYALSFRKFDMKDKTDEYTFQSSVRGDVGASYSATGYSRESEGFGTRSLKAEVHVLPVRGLRLGASYGQDERTYDRREYADVKDDVFGVAVDYARDKVAFHGAFTLLARQPGDENHEAIQPSWQGATQTDITERDRHVLSGLLTLMPTAKVSVVLSGARQTNEFAESVTGLLDQSFDQVGVDVTAVPNERLTLTAGYVYERYFFDMAAGYIPRGTPGPYTIDRTRADYWENATEDEIHTFRAGFEWKVRPEKLDVAASLDYSKPESDSQFAFNPGGFNEGNGVFPANSPAVPGFAVTTFTAYPLVSKELVVARLKASYHVDENLTASVLWWWQKYDNADWQTENPGANGEIFTPYMGAVDPGANRWFFLGARVPSYDANVFRVSLTYRF